MVKPDYKDIADEFAAMLTEWHELEEYARDAIVRDALHRLTDFWSFWCNDPRATQNGRIRPIAAYVKTYVELVESLIDGSNRIIWAQWGTTLRMMEIG